MLAHNDTKIQPFFSVDLHVYTSIHHFYFSIYLFTITVLI